jgi:uncharacterized protein
VDKDTFKTVPNNPPGTEWHRILQPDLLSLRKSVSHMSAVKEPLKQQYFLVLSSLLVLFCLRVLGQLLVALFHVSFLPPMEDWFSGAIPYVPLLFCQTLIILAFGKICFDFRIRDGYFSKSKPNLGSWLLLIGSLYLAIMIIRFAIRMSLYPHERWLGGSIPIFFHCVLASFLIVLGTYHHADTDPATKERIFTITSSRGIYSKALFAATAVIGTLIWFGVQMMPCFVAQHLNLRPSEFAVRVEKHASFKTADGISLVSEIYHPEHIKRTPTILVRIPFSKSLKNCYFANLVGRLWAERGYTVVIQGTRGRYESGGTMYPLINERKDGIETLRWIAKQPWFNGKIGTWGGSAFGYTQWCISDQINPGPSALDVYESSSDFHGMFYPGGAFSLCSALNWAANSYGECDRPNWVAPDLIIKAASDLPMIQADRRLVGQDIIFFRDWALHNERDSYWAAIDGANRNRSLRAPILSMAGWYDPFLLTQINDFVQMRRYAPKEVADQSRLIIGPWRHANEVRFSNGGKSVNFRLKSFAVSLPFFDEVLEQPGAIHETAPPVEIFVMGKNQWRSEQEWPLARTKYTELYLTSAGSTTGNSTIGKLSTKKPLTEEQGDTFTYDPSHPVPTAGGAMIGLAPGIAAQNAIESREDVINYTGPVLQDDLEVTGPVCVLLNVSTTAVSTDFTAKLVDVYPDGSAFNVCDGILRRDYVGAERIEEIKIDVWPTSMTFFRGHRIRLEISSSNFPRFNRNLNTGRSNASATDYICARQTIHHGSKYPSRLILPIIPSHDARTDGKGSKL